jgi:hypothetical protein
MGKYWSKDEEECFRAWDDSIQWANRMREVFPPVLMTHKMGASCVGWGESCRECGTPIKVRPRNRHLTEEFIECPISDKPGHGVWASGINITLN